MTTPAWIGLGSNLGDRRAILDAALVALADVPGVAVRAVSSYHETSPVGGPPGQGPFLNAAAHLETTFGPHQLLAALQAIEGHAGRVRVVRWGERTLDLDLLFFGHDVLDAEGLTLPHPRLAVRRFVLAPLAEIAPTFVDPTTGRMVANLLANLGRKPRLVAIDGWPGWQRREIFGRLVEELPGFGISEADLGSPEAVQPDDPSRADLDGLERKAEALKASRWSADALRVPWIVADFCLDFDISWESTKGIWKTQPSLEAEAHLDRKRRIDELSRLALSPTFVLIPHHERHLKRRQHLNIPPLLWSESDEPDAIVAGVVATCRGIEGV